MTPKPFATNFAPRHKIAQPIPMDAQIVHSSKAPQASAYPAQQKVPPANSNKANSVRPASFAMTTFDDAANKAKPPHMGDVEDKAA